MNNLGLEVGTLKIHIFLHTLKHFYQGTLNLYK